MFALLKCCHGIITRICLKCRSEKKGKDKCVLTGKDSECSICVGALKIPHKKKSSKSKSTSEKFDDSLLHGPKTMSSQLTSLTSQFEEFK